MSICTLSYSSLRNFIKQKMFTDHSKTGMYEINCEIFECSPNEKKHRKMFKYDFSHLKYQRVEKTTPP